VFRQRAVPSHREVDVQPWGSFVTFDDPDGNGWILQELSKR
jgi:hypothetical protein